MSKKSKNKNKQRKSYRPKTRIKDAQNWLIQHEMPQDLVSAYSKRYNCSLDTAYWELRELGFKDEVDIQSYEKDGIEWEYKVDGYTGEMLVVPKGTEDSELHNFY